MVGQSYICHRVTRVPIAVFFFMKILFFIFNFSAWVSVLLETTNCSLSLNCLSSAVCVSVHVTCTVLDVWIFLPVANPAVTGPWGCSSGAQLPEVRKELFSYTRLISFHQWFTPFQ